MFTIADQYGKDKFNDIIRHVEKEQKRRSYANCLPEMKPDTQKPEKTANILLGFLVLVMNSLVR